MTIYRSEVPEIIVTLNDWNILHTKNGEFLFPKFKKGEMVVKDWKVIGRGR